MIQAHPLDRSTDPGLAGSRFRLDAALDAYGAAFGLARGNTFGKVRQSDVAALDLAWLVILDPELATVRALLVALLDAGPSLLEDVRVLCEGVATYAADSKRTEQDGEGLAATLRGLAAKVRAA